MEFFQIMIWSNTKNILKQLELVVEKREIKTNFRCCINSMQAK